VTKRVSAPNHTNLQRRTPMAIQPGTVDNQTAAVDDRKILVDHLDSTGRTGRHHAGSDARKQPGGLASAAEPGLEVRAVHGKACVCPQPASAGPGPREVGVRIVGCSKCGADVNVLSGDKDAPGLEGRCLGHEGYGVPVDVGPEVVSVAVGNSVVVLPHRFQEKHEADCPAFARGADEGCIGLGHTVHMGWGDDGVFAAYRVVPENQLIVLPAPIMASLSEAAPDLPDGAVATLVEPLACALTGVERILAVLGVSRPLNRDVAVIGAGHIGRLICEVLLDAGARVWIKDTVAAREALALAALDPEGVVSLSEQTRGGFDMVIDTTGKRAAVEYGFQALRPGGLFYAMAGLGAADRDLRDPTKAIILEVAHRNALEVRIKRGDGVDIVVSGHSGYRRALVPVALNLAARRAATVAQILTGVIEGFDSTRVRSRNTAAAGWESPTGEAAVLAVLADDPALKGHVSVFMRPTRPETLR
jgi:threonine dehydrogenase-like Zn-dependent dehydrogenase